MSAVDDLNATTTLALSLCALMALVIGWMRWARPRVREARQDGRAIRDAILGREAVRDSITGKEIAPPLPGIGKRMEHQETQMSEMTRAVTQLAETHTQMIEIRKEVSDLAGRVDKLEEGAVERVVTRAESAAAWRAIEAAHNAQPDVTVEDD